MSLRRPLPLALVPCLVLAVTLPGLAGSAPTATSPKPAATAPKTMPASKLASATVSLPSGCTSPDNWSQVTCSYSANTATSLTLSGGAYDVTYDIGAGAGNGPDSSGQGGAGAEMTGSLGPVGGTTLHIGVGQQGGSNPDRTYGNFDGGGAGCGGGGGHCGDNGGAATTIGSNSTLLVVAGGGGGGGGNYGGTGGHGGNGGAGDSGGHDKNTAGDKGASESVGGGGGGGGGGYWAGSGGGTCGFCYGGGGHGGSDDTFGSADGSWANYSTGQGFAHIYYYRSYPDMASTMPSGTVTAWQSTPVRLSYSVTSSTGTPTGTVVTTDTTTGQQVCSFGLSNGYGYCDLSGSQLGGGTHNFRFDYSGDSGYYATSTTNSMYVSPDPTTVALKATDQGSGAYKFEASVTPDSTDGIVDGTLALSSTAASGDFADQCKPTTAPTPSDAQRNLPLTLTCTATQLPGDHTVTATFTGTANSASGFATADAKVRKYDLTGNVLKLDPITLDHYGATTTATVTLTAPTGALALPTGQVDVELSDGSGQPCVATRNTPAAGANHVVYSCTVTPPAGDRTYVAKYVGDDDYSASNSNTVDISTTRTTPTLTIDTAPDQVTVGDKVTLTSTVADPNKAALTTGKINFYDGPVAPDNSNLVGSVDVGANHGGGSIQITPSAGPHVYYAQYVDASGNYVTVTVHAASLYVQPLSATMTVTALGDASAATSAGIPTTVTATVTMPKQDTLTGKIAFTPGPPSDCDRAEDTSGTQRVVTWTCHYVATPGAQPTYSATYTDDLVYQVFGSENSYVIPASPTTVTADATSVDFGTAPTLHATVTPTVTGAAVTGTVAFTEGTKTLCQATVTVGAKGAEASCLPTGSVGAGSHSVIATFTPSASTHPTATGDSSPPAGFTVRAVAASITMTTSQGSDTLTVSVNATPDSGAAAPTPTGSITFGDALASCGTVALSGGQAVCLIDLPAPGAKVHLAATYQPSADFTKGDTSSIGKDYQRPSSGPCNTSFGTFWNKVPGSGKLDESAGALGTVQLTINGSLGNCDAAASIDVSAHIQLFGDTLQADKVTGSVSQADGLCLTGGSVSMPSIWNAGALTVTAPICFPLHDDGTIGAPTGGTLSLAKGSSASLPLLDVPGVSGPATLQARLGSACANHTVDSPGTCDSPTPAVTVTGTVGAASSTVPGVTVVATARADWSIDASVTSTVMNVFGGSIQLAGSVSRDGTSHALSASVGATLAADASPVAGLTLKSGATVSLSGGTGTSPELDVSGTVAVAQGSAAEVDVDVSGSFTSADDYDLDLASSDPAPSWTPVSGLTISPVLSGFLKRADGTTTFGISATGSTGNDLGTFDGPGGVSMAVHGISLGGDPTKVDLDCPYSTGVVAALSGSMSVGGLTVAAGGCVALGTSGWHIDATASSGSVGGLTLAGLALHATHPAGGATSVAGSATATLAVGSVSGSTTVTMSVENGVFVIGGQLDATSLGLPSVSTYLAYASEETKDWQTGVDSIGDDGVIDLPAGVSLFGSLTLSDQVASVLRGAHFDLPSDATVTFEAVVPKGATGLEFTAALATPSGFPLLKLPGGATIDSAVITYADKTFGLTADGTVKGQDGSAAPTHLAVTISADGNFSGSASITGLSLFGRSLDLSGSVSRTNGKFSANVAAALTGDVTLGDATLSDVTVAVGTDGLGATGTIAVGSASLDFTAAFASTASYSLTVQTSIRNWTPVSGVTVNAAISGQLSHTKSGYSYDFAVAPLSGDSLLTVTPASGVTLAMQNFELSNGSTVPAGCRLSATGDTWLAVSGSVSLSLAGASGTAVGSGCFDLTKPAFTLVVSVPGANFGGAGGKVTLGNLTVTISKVGSDFTVEASARLNVQMPRGGQFSIVATLTFSDDGFAIGGVADLSSYLGGSAARAFLFYADRQMKVDTGDATLGQLTVQSGITVGLDFTVSDSVSAALNHVGISVGSGSSLAAVANLNLADATITLSVSLAFQQTDLFDLSNGTYLRLNTLSLQMTLSPTQPSFGFAVSATLHVPSTVPGGSPSDIGLSGGISIGTQLSAYLSISDWNDALGISGLRLQNFTLQGGITLTGLPLPSLAISASVDGLPQKLADILGYQQGVPMSIALAVGETNLLLDIKIGTKDSTQVALAPFTYFGKADLLSVNYAELYISPTGATIGTQVYAPGFSVAFQGTIAGVDVDVFAKIDPVAMSFYFSGKVGVINIGAITIGPTVLTIDASPTSFNITFSGHLGIGPSTTQIGPLLRFSGYLSADVSLAVGTSGISAHMNFDASVTGSNYLPQDWCKWHGIWVLCDYEWVDDSPLTIHLDNLGFDINSSGLTVDIPDTASSITFPFPGHGSSAAAARPLTAGARSSAHVQTLDPSAFHEPLRTPAASTPPSTTASNWHGTGSLGNSRVVAGSLALQDGSVLVAGGSGQNGTALRQAELYSPKTGGWTATGSMATARVNPTLVQLRDGRVLAVGGDTGTGETASAELYDPHSGRWSPAGQLSQARQGASAAVLPDGRVLVAGGHIGGHPVTTVDIYDPATHRWTAGPALHTARAASAAASLADGDVLLAGGMGEHGPLRSVEIYSVTKDAWVAARPMAHARFYASATRLADGRVLVAGDAAQAETYSPATGKWTKAGSQAGPASLSSMVTLPNGHVLVAGGLSAAGALTQVDEFDPATGHWTRRASLPVATGGAAAAPVPGGVLVAGGLAHGQAQQGAFVYAPHDQAVPTAPYAKASSKRVAAAASSAGWSTLDTVWLVVGVVLALLLGAVVLLVRRRRQPAAQA